MITIQEYIIGVGGILYKCDYKVILIHWYF